jgi:hypothetical protein
MIHNLLKGNKQNETNKTKHVGLFLRTQQQQKKKKITNLILPLASHCCKKIDETQNARLKHKRGTKSEKTIIPNFPSNTISINRRSFRSIPVVPPDTSKPPRNLMGDRDLLVDKKRRETKRKCD